MLRLLLANYYLLLPLLAAVIITALFYYHAAYRHPAYLLVPMGVAALGLLVAALGDLLVAWLNATGSLTRGLPQPSGANTMDWLGYIQAVDARRSAVRLWYTLLGYPILVGLVGTPFAHRLLRQVRVEVVLFLVSLALLTHPLLYQLIVTPTLLQPPAPIILKAVP